MGTVDWWADTKPLTASVTAVVTQKLSLIQVCVACNSAEESCWLFHACHWRENFCRRHRFQQPRQFVLMQLNNVVTNHRAATTPLSPGHASKTCPESQTDINCGQEALLHADVYYMLVWSNQKRSSLQGLLIVCEQPPQQSRKTLKGSHVLCEPGVNISATCLLTSYTIRICQ